MKKQIWTFGYRPFVMGGNVHYIIATTVEVGPPVSLGKGFVGHLVEIPGGKKRVVESTTGAIIGDSLSSVKKDVAAADKQDMADQVALAARQLKTLEVHELKPADFWNVYTKSK